MQAAVTEKMYCLRIQKAGRKEQARDKVLSWQRAGHSRYVSLTTTKFLQRQQG